MSPRSTVIQLDQLTKSFGKLTAVDNVSLSIGAGDIVGFVGPNGAGKTTTIATMMGFLRPTKGSICLFGDKLTVENASGFHQRIGYAAGDMALLDNLNGQQYLNHMANLTRCNHTRQKELIELFNPVLGKRLKTLSRGNKQKIALIAALQHNPKLLILDEPTSGLDPLMQETFLSILKKESEQGVTVFMSSHILSEVTDICERVLFMKQGEIILDQPVKEIEKQAGKEVRIKADKQTLLKLLRTKPKSLGHPTTSGDGYVACMYNGAIPDLLHWLANQKISDVEIRDRDFDSIFHEMYRTDEES